MKGALWWSAATDLLLGVACLECGDPGAEWCDACTGRWQGRALRVSGDLDDLAVHAAGPYAADLRRAILTHKEQSAFSLGADLGGLLAGAVADLLVAQWAGQRSAAGRVVTLVPVPSTSQAVRRRGYDATRAMTRAAARTLTAAGSTSRMAPMLRMRSTTRDQAGLDREQRARNLHNAMRLRPRQASAWERRDRVGPVVLCDDVTTTGASLREAARALAARGVPCAGAAVVAVVP